MKESKIIISEVMMPSQANPSGNVHGGEIMKLMDSAAYAAARRYARSNVVTARVDELVFHLPILIGDLVVCSAEVVFTGHTSMEVAVQVEAEDLQHFSKPQKALSAYFTMVALDRNSRPMPVKPVQLETEDQKVAYADGKRHYDEYKAKQKLLSGVKDKDHNILKSVKGKDVQGVEASK